LVIGDRRARVKAASNVRSRARETWCFMVSFVTEVHPFFRLQGPSLTGSLLHLNPRCSQDVIFSSGPGLCRWPERKRAGGGLNRPFSGATSRVFCAYTASARPEEAFEAARDFWL
jgi:hypothetical protein